MCEEEGRPAGSNRFSVLATQVEEEEEEVVIEVGGEGDRTPPGEGIEGEGRQEG